MTEFMNHPAVYAALVALALAGVWTIGRLAFVSARDNTKEFKSEASLFGAVLLFVLIVALIPALFPGAEEGVNTWAAEKLGGAS